MSETYTGASRAVVEERVVLIPPAERLGPCAVCEAEVFLDHPHICSGAAEKSLVERDAERYRWLRSRSSNWAPLFSELFGVVSPGARLSSRYVDAAFDEKVDETMARSSAPEAPKPPRLAGCPHCGAAPPTVAVAADPSTPQEAGLTRVACRHCGAAGGARIDARSAVEAWNRRPEHPRGCACAACREKVM